ncbi:10537_t:CDS:1, partial [Acaulospora morrowiae]
FQSNHTNQMGNTTSDISSAQENSSSNDMNTTTLNLITDKQLNNTFS